MRSSKLCTCAAVADQIVRRLFDGDLETHSCATLHESDHKFMCLSDRQTCGSVPSDVECAKHGPMSAKLMPATRNAYMVDFMRGGYVWVRVVKGTATKVFCDNRTA